MKKTLSVSLIIVAAISIAAAAISFKPAAGAASETVSQVSTAPASAATLPAGIDDPRILAAWKIIYAQQAPIQLWDGSTLNGRQLALFLLEQNIPVRWDTENVCKGGSCSAHYCNHAHTVCDYEDGQPGVDPIYIRPGEQNDIVAVADTLAHEIFHRMLPFGAVPDTQFEEYWAFYIGETVGNDMVLKFAAYDPLQPGMLALWIKVNRVDGYLAFPEYPDSVKSMVHSAASNAVVNNPNGLPAAALGGSQP